MAARSVWTSERGSLWAVDLEGTAMRPVAPRCQAGFGEAGPEDGAALAAVMGLPDAEIVLQRLGEKRRCFTAHVGGRLVAYGWVSYNSEHVGELERTFHLRDGEVYIWNCGTLPGYRGKRLYTALLCHMLAELRGDGVRRVWIGAAIANRPSIKGIVNAGFRPVARVLYVRVFRVSVFRVSKARDAPPDIVAEARRIMADDRERALGPLAIGL